MSVYRRGLKIYYTLIGSCATMGGLYGGYSSLVENLKKAPHYNAVEDTMGTTYDTVFGSAYGIFVGASMGAFFPISIPVFISNLRK